MHDAHIRLALRLGADAICEKPLVLKPSNLDALHELESETGRKIYNVLQLRVHPALIELRDRLLTKKSAKKHNVVLTYITSRGPWYRYSWKGNEEKSGGIVTNIGIHFFDLLMWLFGKVQQSDAHVYTSDKACGFIELENACVQWFLSIDSNNLPKVAIANGQTTYRSITVDGEEIEFTKGFTDLHSIVYKDILNGGGFGIDDARQSIDLVYSIRNTKISSKIENPHPYYFNTKE